MKRERSNVKVNKIAKSKKKITIKTYLKDFLEFINKNMIKTTSILLVIAILLIAISIKFITAGVFEQECIGGCKDDIGMFAEYGSRLQVLFVITFAGIVPYMYAPAIGFIGYILSEVTNFSYVIREYGYAAGIGLGIVPMLLNLIIGCVIAALGIYICRTITVGYKIASVKSMNFTNFRIKLYEVLQNDKKVKEFTQKRDNKLAKLQDRKEKLNYLQILNVSLLVCVLQFVAVVIKEILT